MTRHFIYAFIATLALSIADPAHAELTKIGVVGNLSGSVAATSADGTVRELSAGAPVYLNDVIDSQAGSKAQIMFLDKSALMVNPNTKVTVDKFVYNPATASGDLSIQSAKGALRFIGGALSKEKPVHIKTPVATIGIRGGIADAHIGAGGATDAIFVYGEEMTMANGQGQMQSITTPGQGLSVLDGTSMPQPTPPERVQQHLATFQSEGAGNAGGGDDGSNGDNGGDSAPAIGRGEDGPNGDGESNGNGEGPNDGGPRDGNNPNNSDKQGGGEAKGDTPRGGPDAKGQASGPNGGPRNGTAGGPKGPAPTNMANVNKGPGGPAPLAGLHVNHLTGNATQEAQRNEGVVNITQKPLQITDEGMYALTNSKGEPVSAGRAQFEDRGDRMAGRLVQGYPNPTDGPRFVVNLPGLKEGGYQDVKGVKLEGRTFNGHGYRTADGGMAYYDIGTDKGTLRTVIGNRLNSTERSVAIARSDVESNANVSEGIAFYDFLPDIAGFTAEKKNFFDYNIADHRLDGSDTSRPSMAGLLVDWDKKSFFTGRVNWATNSDPIQDSMAIAFGKVGTDVNMMEGSMFEYITTKHNGATVGFGDGGFIRSTDTYAADYKKGFSGMMLEGIMPDDNKLDGTDAFHLTNEGPRVFQAVVQGDVHENIANSAEHSTGNTQHGFSAGFVNQQNGSTHTTRAYGSYNVTDVKIDPNANNGTVYGYVKMDDLHDSGRISQGYIKAEFGDTPSGTSHGNSAYLTDEVYAAQGAKYYVKEDGETLKTYGSAATQDMALVSAQHISNLKNGCDDCQFVHWGVWAGGVDRSISGTNVNVADQIAMIPYVAGNVTENLKNISPQNLGEVDYQGTMIGSLAGGGSITRHEGSFTAGVDLNNRVLTDFQGQFAGMNFGTNTAQNIQSSGFATFKDVDVYGTGSGGSTSVSGTINGALFGPNAENIGGNFDIQNHAAQQQALGVFMGTR